MPLLGIPGLWCSWTWFGPRHFMTISTEMWPVTPSPMEHHVGTHCWSQWTQSLVCPQKVPTQGCLFFLSPVSTPFTAFCTVEQGTMPPVYFSRHCSPLVFLSFSHHVRCGSSQNARLCVTTCTNNPDTSGFPHTYPDGFMGFPQDSNPKERIILLASDQSTLLSPLFKYFILSSVLRHMLFHVLTLLLCIFIDTCKKFSEIKTQE